MVEKLANTERHLDVSKTHSQRAEDKTDELKQLNRSIFRPVIHFNKDAKRAAQERKIQLRYDEEREERENAMKDIRDTQNRLGQASTYGQREEEAIGARPNGKGPVTASQRALQKDQRKRYQFEATGSDDELEDELDDNLDEISDVAKRLKALGTAMGQELDNQNNRIERIEEKTVKLDNKVFSNTERVCQPMRSHFALIFIVTVYSSNESSRDTPQPWQSLASRNQLHDIWTIICHVEHFQWFASLVLWYSLQWNYFGAGI